MNLTDLFFGDFHDLRDEPIDERWEREDECKLVCNGCDVKLECLQWALESGEDYGVWGGMGQGERYRFKKWLKREGIKSKKYDLTEIRPHVFQEVIEEFREYEVIQGRIRARKAKKRAIKRAEAKRKAEKAKRKQEKKKRSRS